MFGNTKREDACPHGASALVRGQILKERVSASDGTVEQIEQGDGMSSLLDVREHLRECGVWAKIWKRHG